MAYMSTPPQPICDSTEAGAAESTSSRFVWTVCRTKIVVETVGTATGTAKHCWTHHYSLDVRS